MKPANKQSQKSLQISPIMTTDDDESMDHAVPCQENANYSRHIAVDESMGKLIRIVRRTPLQMACWTGNVEMVERVVHRTIWALQNKASTREHQNNNNKSLWEATRRFLLPQFEQCLLLAIQLNHLDIVRFFVESMGMNVNFCAPCSTTDVEQRQEQHGDSPDSSNSKNGLWTPLSLAAHCGNLEVVSFLLDTGANLSAPTNADENKGALFHAISQSRTDVIHLLLDWGALLQLQQEPQQDSLLLEAIGTGSLEITLLLAAYGAPLYQNKFLLAACRLGQVEIVQHLVESGRCSSSDDDSADCPLSVASRFGHVNVIYYLLRNQIESPMLRGAFVGGSSNAASLPRKRQQCHNDQEDRSSKRVKI